MGQVPPAKIDGKQERNSRHSKKQRNSAASTTSTTSNSTTTLRQQQQTTTTTAISRTNRQKSNRTDQSPTKARKAKKEAAVEMNSLPKMPPIGAKKKADAVQPLAQPKPDVVQVADETEAPAAIDVKNQDEKEGNETNEVSHDDEGIAAEEEPDEDFEFGDQTEAELAAISQ